jgi:ribosome-binding factor A
MSKRTHRSGARPSRAQQSTLTPGGPDSVAVGHRQERLEHILLDEIQRLVRDEASDPALAGVRLVSVQLSVDGGHARIAYAVVAQLADEQRVEQAAREAFARATGFLRARLAALLDLKRLPKASFTFVGVQEPGATEPKKGGDPWLA